MPNQVCKGGCQKQLWAPGLQQRPPMDLGCFTACHPVSTPKSLLSLCVCDASSRLHNTGSEVLFA
eukprot:scaffold28917_cov20-Tisochrysis_lutea.AAC.1